MSTTAAIIIGVVAVVVLAALAFVTLARRSDVRGAGALSAETVRRDTTARRARASGADQEHARTAADAEAEGAAARTGTELVPVTDDTELEPWTPPDPEAIGVSRRQFFNRATVGLMGASLGTFSAAAMVAFLWPTSTGGFGGKVNVGRLNEIQAGIAANSGFFYAPEARSWITAYPSEALAEAESVYQPAVFANMQEGIVISYQKCPHLGCRVPQCESSQWFECGCHGSQYNRVGEKKAGPAPRGLDHFSAEITAAGEVIIDTGTIWQGPPIGVNTTGQEAEGPHCVGAADH